MSEAATQALTMGIIALPTMFVVILVFMLATSALHKAFPAVVGMTNNPELLEEG